MSQEPPIADALVSIPSGQAILLARGPILILDEWMVLWWFNASFNGGLLVVQGDYPAW